MGVCRQVVARPVQRVEPNPNALICYVDMQKSVGSRTASMSFGVFRDMPDTRLRSVELFTSQAHACMASAVHLFMMSSHII